MLSGFSPAPYILTLSHWLEVRRTNTRRVQTEMIENQIFRRQASEGLFPHRSMRPHFLLTNSDSSVAGPIPLTVVPIPAEGLVSVVSGGVIGFCKDSDGNVVTVNESFSSTVSYVRKGAAPAGTKTRKIVWDEPTAVVAPNESHRSPFDPSVLSGRRLCDGRGFAAAAFAQLRGRIVEGRSHHLRPRFYQEAPS